jgi:multidrug efflux pump
LNQDQITDYLTRVVQPKLSVVAGVQRAEILGDRTFAMRIWLKPDKMAALGISPSIVQDALARNNSLSALGRTKGSMVSVNMVANTDLRKPEEFRQLVVKEQNGTVVRLGEIADVMLGAENYDSDVRFNGEAATFMGVWVPPKSPTLRHCLRPTLRATVSASRGHSLAGVYRTGELVPIVDARDQAPSSSAYQKSRNVILCLPT